MKENKLVNNLIDKFIYSNRIITMVRKDYESTVDKSRNYKIISKFFRISKIGE